MTLIADILLLAGTLGAVFYCYVLSRRLRRFNDLEKGIGGAVAVLSAQVDDMTKTLRAARTIADGSGAQLETLTARAEAAAKRLELHFAAMHDFDAKATPKTESSSASRTEDEGDHVISARPVLDPWDVAPKAPAEDRVTPTEHPDARPTIFTSKRAHRLEAAE